MRDDLKERECYKQDVRVTTRIQYESIHEVLSRNVQGEPKLELPLAYTLHYCHCHVCDLDNIPQHFTIISIQVTEICQY